MNSGKREKIGEDEMSLVLPLQQAKYLDANTKHVFCNIPQCEQDVWHVLLNK